MADMTPDSSEKVELPSGRRQTPSVRAVQAVKNLAGNGGNKAKALRDAGYSETIQNTPERVFNSPTVRALLEKNGMGAKRASKAIASTLKADYKHVETIPDYDDEVEGSLTDAQLIALYKQHDIIVGNIRHEVDRYKEGKRNWREERKRVITMFLPSHKNRMVAAELLTKIIGELEGDKVPSDTHNYFFGLDFLRKARERNEPTPVESTPA